MRVAIADDTALFRAGVTSLLTAAGMTVTVSVGDAQQLMSAIGDDPPDVAILEIRMPPTHTLEGLEAALAVRRDHPAVGVLVLSQYVETRHVADLLSAGGRTATCSRSASPTPGSSRRPCTASRPAGRWSTPR